MEKKICSNCKEDLSINNFSKKGFYSNGRQRYQYTCKKCHKKYKDQHYINNKQYYKDKARKTTITFIEWFTEIKKTLFCELCGENRHWVLDFHHIDPKEKDREIAVLMRNGSKRKILDEIKKCKVLCSNCHRNLHYTEKHAPVF